MLVLTFRVNQIPYGIPVSQVIEVIPRVGLRQVPHSAASFLGLLHYRGQAVPVIDLGLLMGSRACVDRLDTRILLVRGSTTGQLENCIGLLAEQVNDLLEVDGDRIARETSSTFQAPYLGQVYETKNGLLQLIAPDRIIVASIPEARGALEP